MAIARPEYEQSLAPLPADIAIQAPLPWHERLLGHAWLRKVLILLLLALAWEAMARYTDNDLLLPGAWQTARAFFQELGSGQLPARAALSFSVLFKGYAAGVALAFVLTTLAVSTRFGRDLLSTLTAMFNPLPAIALLPLAMLWFGLGQGSLVFVLIHSVLWAMAVNMYSGFLTVSETLRMAGRNYGLTGLRYVLGILVPAALPSILSGLRIAWAFAWRTLIAAELVGRDRESAQRDLFQNIEQGQFPRWTLKVQVMPEAECSARPAAKAGWAGTSSRIATSYTQIAFSPAWPPWC
ncbi:ABC transporter, permease protein [Bordetella pertussis H939]|nr:ABC transporter, permease protein [Bordetella pertussis H939]